MGWWQIKFKRLDLPLPFLPVIAIRIPCRKNGVDLARKPRGLHRRCVCCAEKVAFQSKSEAARASAARWTLHGLEALKLRPTPAPGGTEALWRASSAWQTYGRDTHGPGAGRSFCAVFCLFHLFRPGAGASGGLFETSNIRF